jgi:hypothetical protein
MRKVSLCNSIFVLALGGITQACTAPVDNIASSLNVW